MRQNSIRTAEGVGREVNEFREQRLRALEEWREQLVVSVRTSLAGSELLVRQRFAELDAECTDLGIAPILFVLTIQSYNSILVLMYEYVCTITALLI